MSRPPESPRSTSLMSGLSNLALSVRSGSKGVSLAVDAARRKITGESAFDANVHSPEFVTQKRMLKQSRLACEGVIDSARHTVRSGTRFVEDSRRLVTALSKACECKAVQDAMVGEEHTLGLLLEVQTQLISAVSSALVSVQECFDIALQPHLTTIEDAREEKNKCYGLMREREVQKYKLGTLKGSLASPEASTRQLYLVQEQYRTACLKFSRQERVSVCAMMQSQSSFVLCLLTSLHQYARAVTASGPVVSALLVQASELGKVLQMQVDQLQQEQQKEMALREGDDKRLSLITREREGLLTDEELRRKFPNLDSARKCDLARHHGEGVVMRVEPCMLLDQHASVLGVMFCTNYRLCFCPYCPMPGDTWGLKLPAFEMPLSSVCRMEDFGGEKGLLVVWSHLGQSVNLSFRPSQLTSTDVHQSLIPFVFCGLAQRFVWFVGLRWKRYQSPADVMRTELERMEAWAPEWRVTDANSDYSLCPSYPSVLAVPAGCTDEALQSVAGFRSKNRVAVLTWKASSGGRGGGGPPMGCLLRSSQPCIGLKRASTPDHQLLSIYAAMGKGKLLVIDARPVANAVANVAKGGGWETDAYSDCEVEFMGIGNIHVVRHCFAQLRANCSANQPADLLEDQDEKEVPAKARERALSDGGGKGVEWDGLRARLLSASLRIVRAVATGTNTLVHCSDGWDRTPQLLATAMLVLDPYYRSLSGFCVLIDKEWLMFGHRFGTRCGIGEEGRANYFDRQRSPVFVQWLDCVYQLLCQVGSAFEFTPALLAFLACHVDSSRFGDFFYNCERERIQAGVPGKTDSIFTFIQENPAAFINPNFAPQPPVLAGIDPNRHFSWPFLESVWSNGHEQAVAWDLVRKASHGDNNDSEGEGDEAVAIEPEAGSRRSREARGDGDGDDDDDGLEAPANFDLASYSKAARHSYQQGLPSPLMHPPRSAASERDAPRAPLPGTKCIALYAFNNHEQPQEEPFAFDSDDELEVVDGSDADWWYVRRLPRSAQEEVVVGFAPRTYVSVLAYEEKKNPRNRPLPALPLPKPPK